MLSDDMDKKPNVLWKVRNGIIEQCDWDLHGDRLWDMRTNKANIIREIERFADG